MLYKSTFTLPCVRLVSLATKITPLQPWRCGGTCAADNDQATNAQLVSKYQTMRLDDDFRFNVTLEYFKPAKACPPPFVPPISLKLKTERSLIAITDGSDSKLSEAMFAYVLIHSCTYSHWSPSQPTCSFCRPRVMALFRAEDRPICVQCGLVS